MAPAQKYESLLPPLDPEEQKKTRRASVSGLPSSTLAPPSSASQQPSRNSVDSRMFKTNKEEKQQGNKDRTDRPMRLVEWGSNVFRVFGGALR